MERRDFLKSAAAVGLVPGTLAANIAGAAADEAQTSEPDGLNVADLATALAQFRKTIPADFDRTYIENVVVPFFLTSLYEGERPLLPMIDLNFTKEMALPYHLWGMLYEDWKPAPDEGVTVFLQGLEKRGDNNLRKRIYFSAVTPDLYGPMYKAKVASFLDQLFAPQFSDKPFMRHYLDDYWNVYWDLHLGVKGADIPKEVIQVGEGFNTVLAYRNPTLPVFYENYMTVRKHLPFLKEWADKHIDDIVAGRTANAEKTMVWYWMKNAGNGEHFSKKDIIFECFHNFVAFSQWGNSIFGVMSRLSENSGNAEIRAAFQKTMTGDYDNANGAPYTPLELFVMELFRVISPNGGSLSSIEDAREATFFGESPHARLGLHFERGNYISTPHTSTSLSPVHWQNPEQFDPERYLSVPTSAEIDEERVKKIGLTRCPFDITTFRVQDGRNVGLANSGFGTVFGVADGKPIPVCDYAGFAPFGFGYRRCPGEQLTIQVFEDFLRKVWHDKIAFRKLDLPNPGRVPVGPSVVIDDNLGFSRSS